MGRRGGGSAAVKRGARTLDIGLRLGPRKVRFFTSEVPLYTDPVENNTDRSFYSNVRCGTELFRER